MRNRVQQAAVLVFVSLLFAGLVLPAAAQTAAGPIEPGAGGWRTWGLASGKELRLPPPPDAQATAIQLHETAEEAARSRVLAGVVYPSDARAGLEPERAGGGRVIEAMKLDGQKWAGTIPVGPGLWQGTNPGT